MKLNSSNVLMISGFVISFAAIILNAIILTNINGKIAAIDGESLKLNESLREQLTNGNEAEAKFNDFLIAKMLADSAPAASRESAYGTASVMVNEALTYLYAAANDVPMLEIRRIESEAANSEEMQQNYEEAKKALENPPPSETVTPAESKDGKAGAPENEQKQSEEKQAERAQLEQAQAEIVKFDLEANFANLPKKISAIDVLSDAVTAAASDAEMLVKLFPLNKALNGRWVGGVRTKQTRLAELSLQKSDLIRYQTYSTFIALSLQMLGLMIVIIKDVLKSREDKS